LPPAGSAVDDIASTLKQKGMADLKGTGGIFIGSCLLLLLSFLILVVATCLSAMESVADVLAYTGTAFLVFGLVGMTIAGSYPSWVEGESGKPTKSEEDAAYVVKLLPLMPPIVAFWLVYSMQTTLFQLQGEQMNLHTMGTKVSPATLNVFDSVGVMAFTPMADLLIYPAMRSCGIEPNMFRKISIGFVFAAASVGIAGVIEIWRKSTDIADPGTGTDEPENDLSIWWQAPQYLVVAMAEVFVAITTYELFYITLPAHIRSIGQGLNLLTTSLGGLAVLGVSACFRTLMPENLNEGHLEIVFFVVGGIMLLMLPIWAYVGSRFEVPNFAKEEE